MKGITGGLMREAMNLQIKVALRNDVQRGLTRRVRTLQ